MKAIIKRLFFLTAILACMALSAFAQDNDPKKPAPPKPKPPVIKPKPKPKPPKPESATDNFDAKLAIVVSKY